MIKLWTDGSASPNPGRGGFAVLLEENGEVRPVVLGRDQKETTNIRMEGEALYEAMKYAGGEECAIYTDSQFWVNVITRWAPAWEKWGWRKADGKAPENGDIVKKDLEEFRRGKVNFVFVRGHMGTEFNEAADAWANKAREGERPDGVKFVEITPGEE